MFSNWKQDLNQKCSSWKEDKTNFGEKNVCQKTFSVGKNVGSKKNVGPKKIWVLK